MPQEEHVETLLAKAESDERALDILLASGAAPLEAVGFHAQQATEKLLKAALKATGHPFPLTHDLWGLARALRRVGVGVPDDVRLLRVLTPFAGEFRYGGPDFGPDWPFDPIETRRRIRQLREWVEGLVEARGRSDDLP